MEGGLMPATRVSPTPHPAVRVARPVVIRFLVSLVADSYNSFLKLELTDKENRDLPHPMRRAMKPLIFVLALLLSAPAQAISTRHVGSGQYYTAIAMAAADAHAGAST